MGIMVHSLLWVMQDLYHQPCKRPRIAKSQFALDPWLQNSWSKDVQLRDNAAYRKAMLSGFEGQALLAPGITKTAEIEPSEGFPFRLTRQILGAFKPKRP